MKCQNCKAAWQSETGVVKTFQREFSSYWSQDGSSDARFESGNLVTTSPGDNKLVQRLYLQKNRRVDREVDRDAQLDKERKTLKETEAKSGRFGSQPKQNGRQEEKQEESVCGSESVHLRHGPSRHERPAPNSSEARAKLTAEQILQMLEVCYYQSDVVRFRALLEIAKKRASRRSCPRV